VRSLAVTLVCIALTSVPSFLAAQQQRKCGETTNPKKLPAPSVLVDSARAIADLAPFELPPEGIVFSLVFNAIDSLPRTRPLETVDPRALVAFVGALRPQKPAGVWAVRVRVVGGASAALTLERSVYCPAVTTDRAVLPERIRVEVRAGDRMPTGSRGRMRLVVEVMVSETGEALNVKLVEPSGVRELDEEVTRIWQARRFHPALVDGMPMQTWYRTDGRSPKL
jgi:TonB family protein